jgi:hypothetical protein
MSILYDSLEFNKYCVFNAVFREGTGTITQDISKNHSVVTLVNTPTWSALDTGKGYLTLNGTNEYLEAQAADTGDLDFTTGDYSLCAWFNWTTGGDDSQIIMGRYELNVSGWELYLYTTLTMTLRHHHAGGAAVRSAQYSAGWSYDKWWFVGISKPAGEDMVFYRGSPTTDIELIPTIGATPEDPETETADLVIGVRYTKNDNNFKGGIGEVACYAKALTIDNWRTKLEITKGWYA